MCVDGDFRLDLWLKIEIKYNRIPKVMIPVNNVKRLCPFMNPENSELATPENTVEPC